ncbi:unnamed protein product [Absidia cylindrospora]
MEPTEIHPAQATVPDFSSWSVNTTECMELGIVTSKDTALFSPEFTYPLFGLHETAFGYKDLAIKLMSVLAPLPNINLRGLPQLAIHHPYLLMMCPVF